MVCGPTQNNKADAFDASGMHALMSQIMSAILKHTHEHIDMSCKLNVLIFVDYLTLAHNVCLPSSVYLSYRSCIATCNPHISFLHNLICMNVLSFERYTQPHALVMLCCKSFAILQHGPQRPIVYPGNDLMLS